MSRLWLKRRSRAWRTPEMPRGVELALALIGAAIFAPLMLLCALLVRLALGSPIVFRQLRAGVSCNPFQMIKFRSMLDKRDASGDLLPDSERTPPVGRLLRRLRLDEMPELLNVIRGEMSLIGPRPLLPHTIETMGANGRLRCDVRPGLTGWAQVNGNSRLGSDEKLALDLWYIRNRSLLLDIVILLRTVGVVLFGEKINEASLENAGARCSSRSC
jgi:lipopolysaccharide/colanic/teichoic acid biosynthesis glycosyltransferase